MNATAERRPPAAIPRSPDPRPGHDEKNLAQFPLALLAKRPPTGLNTIEYRDDYPHPRTRKMITRKVTITGAGKYGLPTAQDEDVLIALLYLTLLDKEPNDLQDSDRTVSFTRRQLFEILGWPDTGDYYERLKKALRRWKGVTIIYENWWDNATGEPRSGETGFSLLDNYQLSDSRRKDKEQLLLFPDVESQPRAQCYIIWNKTPFASFQNGYVKKLDLDTFFCLPTAAAKRAYRYLDADLPGRGHREYDLQAFACEHVGLARNYKPSRLRDEVQKTVVTPLEQADVIEPLSAKRRFLKRDKRYKVIFGRKDQTALLPPEETSAAPAEAPTAKESASHLVDELCRRKLGGKTARDLVAAHPAEYIQQKIDYFDYEFDRGNIKKPAAWLRSAIEDDYGEPAGYLPRDQRERLSKAAEEKQRQDDENKRLKQERERLRKDREEAKKQHKTEHLTRIRASLTAAELQKFERRAETEAADFFRKYFQQHDAHSLMMRGHLIDNQILKDYPLPELEAAD
jgi:hypothetical protein